MTARNRKQIWVPTDFKDYMKHLKTKLVKLTGVDIREWTDKKTLKAMQKLAENGTITKKQAEDICLGRL